MLTHLSPAHCADQSCELHKSKDCLMVTARRPVAPGMQQILKLLTESKYLYKNIIL